MKPSPTEKASKPAMRNFGLLLVIVLATTACLGSDFEDSLNGDWQLIDGEIDGQTLQLVPSHPVTITFAGAAIGGTASCNGYGGTYDLSGSAITVQEVFATEMACLPAATMELESAFLGGLQRVDNILLAETLSLTGENVRLRFERLDPVPDAELTATVWVLDTLIQGDAASSVGGERATLEFFTDGSAIGGTGCRLFSGQYQISGSEVVFTELAADGQECEPELATQDSQVISALEGGFRVEVDGDRMTTWTRGDEGLGYRAEG